MGTIKPMYGQPIDVKTKNEAISYFESILKIVHPFTPFIAEEIWHLIGRRNNEDCIVNASWPAVKEKDDQLLINFYLFENVITQIRTLRKEKNIAQKVKLEITVNENINIDKTFDSRHLIKNIRITHDAWLSLQPFFRAAKGLHHIGLRPPGVLELR